MENSRRGLRETGRVRTSAGLVGSDPLSHPEFIVQLIIAASGVYSPVITIAAAAAATTGMWKRQYPRQE